MLGNGAIAQLALLQFPGGGQASPPPPSDTVGSALIGGYFSRGQWHTVIGEIKKEKRERVERKKREVEAARLEAALTPLQRAERELRAVQAALERITNEFLTNPTKVNYDRVSAASQTLTEVTDRVAALRLEAAEQRAGDRRAKEQKQRELERQAQADADFHARLLQAVNDATAAQRGAMAALAELERLRGVSQWARGEAIRRQQADDDTAAILLLLNNED